MISETPKIVRIKDTSSSMTEGTKEFQKFNSNLFKHDYQEMIQKMFPQYQIEYNLVDDENWFAYPDITGDITDEERDEIISAMESDPLFLSFADNKYFTDINEEHSKISINDNPIQHKDEAKCILTGEYDLSNFKRRKLSSVELNFLIYITRNKNPLEYITREWTYDYHLNFRDVLDQFLGQNLVEIVELNLYEKANYLLKAADLKEILKNKLLPVSGLKSALIKRVIENSSKNELEVLNKKRCIVYNLTEEGKKITGLIKPSITKDLDLEDKCYKLIIEGSINEAYKQIAAFQARRYFTGAWGKDWAKEARVGLNDIELSKYGKLANIEFELPENIRSKQNDINACIVIGIMLNSPSNIIAKLINRLCDLGIEEEQVIKYIEYDKSCFRGY